MLYLVERKKIVIVGIPGVGKTSLVTRIVELINAQKHCASVHSYGTVMMDEAANNQVSDRDNLRHLPVSQQKELQKQAAKKIAEFLSKNKKIKLLYPYKKNSHNFRMWKKYYSGASGLMGLKIKAFIFNPIKPEAPE